MTKQSSVYLFFKLLYSFKQNESMNRWETEKDLMAIQSAAPKSTT